jgi:biopolymer transport protein ExbD
MRIDLPARKPTSISLTPLIDVVFILLVFFMLATRFIDLARQPLSVAAASEVHQEEPQILQLTVLASGDVEVDGVWLPLTALVGHLQTHPVHPVYVGSSEQASLQQVLRVTDLLQQHGRTEVHLELLP